MSPVYDWSNPDDVARYEASRPTSYARFDTPENCLKYALSLSSREERIKLAGYLRKYYGDDAAKRLVADLKRYAENMRTTK